MTLLSETLVSMKEANVTINGTDVTLSRTNINNFAQNKPSLIVQDIIQKYPKVDPDFIYQVLLQRGVFKWLNVRRNLIKLKDDMKVEIRELNRKKTPEEKGYSKALIKTRQHIRKLCHSDRWSVPDFDREANEFLKRIGKRL